MNYVIWDIDNCLADDRHRLPLIDWHLKGNERYARYNAASHKDMALNKPVWRLNSTLGFRPVFFTGRPSTMAMMTGIWLGKSLEFPLASYCPQVYMRDPDDRSSPAALKFGMLERFLRENPDANIVHAYDDVPAIVEMYRANGIAATQLAIHDPSGAYDTTDLLPLSKTN